MKSVMLFFFILCCITSFGDDEYRSFTDLQGRTIKAKLVSFDSKNGKVTIERDNRKRATVSPGIFSVEDQEYIGSWIKIFLLKDGRSLKIDIDSSEKESNRSNPKDIERKMKNYTYKARLYTEKKLVTHTLTLENKGATDFGNIGVDYCTFIKRKGYDGLEDVFYCETGTRVGSLKPNSEALFTTEELPIFHRCRIISVPGEEGYSQDDAVESIEGIIFRIYLADNPTCYFEFSKPQYFGKKNSWMQYNPREGLEKQGFPRE
ncbi:hypothetical protein [Pontiella agarivorans]|uniref:Uncharacterized protein n=1 Tax=Pontiella agarivorans TaxID=3038953 RepID=A0ABU5MUC7_9BACT|nr:hypothetical protein [Pontiella agarivorans]MDZ8117818.1 hypothetical protein [Pontiella agarivorans]